MEEKNSRCYSWVNNGLIVGGLWLLGVFFVFMLEKSRIFAAEKNDKKVMKEQRPLVIPKSTLSRLPIYYCYLQERLREGQMFVSSRAMAESLALNAVQVRKDLATVSSVHGRPKMGFRTEQLLKDMKSYLGYDNYNEVVLVGVGGLGKTLLQYPGFKNYGLDVVAGFDVDERVIGKTVGGKPVYSMMKLGDMVRRLGVKLGIIAVPGPQAQVVADELVSSGIKAIWNFAPAHIELPAGVIFKSENLAASLAVLSSRLSELES